VEVIKPAARNLLDARSEKNRREVEKGQSQVVQKRRAKRGGVVASPPSIGDYSPKKGSGFTAARGPRGKSGEKKNRIEDGCVLYKNTSRRVPPTSQAIGEGG